MSTGISLFSEFEVFTPKDAFVKMMEFARVGPLGTSGTTDRRGCTINAETLETPSKATGNKNKEAMPSKSWIDKSRHHDFVFNKRNTDGEITC